MRLANALFLRHLLQESRWLFKLTLDATEFVLGLLQLRFDFDDLILSRRELLIEVDEIMIEPEGPMFFSMSRNSWRACSTWTLK